MTRNVARASQYMPLIITSDSHDWSSVLQVDKFGANYDIDTTTDPEDVWSQGGTYTFLTSATTLYLSSSDNGDDQTITVEGLDGNYALQSKSKALTGQTQVALDGTWLRVFRAYNGDTTATAGDVYVAETDDLTGGVPDTATKIKAKIDAAAQQTLMAIYTIPAGYTGYLLRWYAGGTNLKTSTAIVELQAQLTGGVFRIKRRIGIAATGSSTYQESPSIALRYPAQTDIKVVVREVGANDVDISAGFDLLLVSTA